MLIDQLQLIDIYSPHQKNLETFVKTEFQNRGDNLGGIVWEDDAVRHREVAKKLAPAFSARIIRAMEPLVHQYINYFVERMIERGGFLGGVGLAERTTWLAMDLSADLSWNEKMYQMRDGKPLCSDSRVFCCIFPQVSFTDFRCFQKRARYISMSSLASTHSPPSSNFQAFPSSQHFSILILTLLQVAIIHSNGT